MDDGRAGLGEGRGSGRARRFPKEWRCRCAAGQRAGRAGAGEGGRGSPLRCSQGATPWGRLEPAGALALGAPTSLFGILR
eukprot:5136700-Prymnesium_polylepis.1